MQVSFKIFDDKQGGFDCSGPAYERALEMLDTALDMHQSGEWTDKKYVAELARLVEAEPDFMDGHAHLAFALHEQGKPRKALEQALQALAIGERVIFRRGSPDALNGATSTIVRSFARCTGPHFATQVCASAATQRR